MIELTGDEIVTTLVMEHQVDPRRVIVVEGPEDFQLLELHLEESAAYLMFAGSKSAALEAARQCIADMISWALFVVDADFDRIRGVLTNYPTNVVASERYDLMMDVVSSNRSLVSRAIISQSPPHTERNLRNAFNISLAELVQQIAAPIGALRFLVVTGKFDLSVNGWPFRGSASDYLSGLLYDSISSRAAERSGKRHPATEIKSQIEMFLASGVVNAEDLVNGHDMIATVAELVRFQSGRSLGHDTLSGTVRAALTCEAFLKLSVVSKIRDWAKVAGGSSVFSCPVHG